MEAPDRVLLALFDRGLENVADQYSSGRHRAQEHNNDNLRLLNLIRGASLQLSLIQCFRSNSRLDIQK